MTRVKNVKEAKPKEVGAFYTALPTLSLVFCVQVLLFFLEWWLMGNGKHWFFLSPPVSKAALLWRCSANVPRGVNLTAQPKTHATDGAFDWLLVLKEVVTLSNSEDDFSQSLHEFSACQG